MSIYVFSLLLASSSALLGPMTNGNGEYDISSVSNHVLLLEQMLSALTTKVSAQTSELSVMKSKYESLQSSWESKYQTLQTALENETKLRDEKDRNVTAALALLNTEVKYEVVLKQDITDQKDGEVLKFDGVKYNAGGGYHSSSGIFVAPASGSYLFWCHVMMEDTTVFYVNLYHEGSMVARGHTRVTYGVASITTVLYVHKGDNVWFAKEAGSPKIDGIEFSSFGGALLHAF